MAPRFLPILLVPLMGRVDLTVPLLSNLVRVPGGCFQAVFLAFVGRLAGTLVRTIGFGRRRQLAIHDILLVWILVGSMVLILFSLDGFAIEAALSRVLRLISVRQDHVGGQRVRLKVGHCTGPVAFALGAGANMFSIRIGHENSPF